MNEYGRNSQAAHFGTYASEYVSRCPSGGYAHRPAFTILQVTTMRPSSHLISPADLESCVLAQYDAGTRTC
jgi:hypothetical protein